MTKTMRIAVVDANGKQIGDIANTATSVGAARIAGGAVRFTTHPTLGRVWQAYAQADWVRDLERAALHDHGTHAALR